MMEALGLGASDYDQLVQQIAALTRAIVPEGSRVLVISKGEDKLIDIQERTAWHFPRDGSGQFAGFNPESSAAAIEHLVSLRTEGAEYLVIPQFSMWWLEYYEGFRNHLSSCYRVVWHGEECAIYDLRTKVEPLTPVL
jgi:hypothetical protein